MSKANSDLPGSPNFKHLTGLEKYEKIRPLGRGAAGEVYLYRSFIDGRQYAIKEINLFGLDAKDRQAAYSEITFLKVLSGPTIIKFHENFNTNESIFVVMEYAAKGCLEQALNRKIASGKNFTKQ